MRTLLFLYLIWSVQGCSNQQPGEDAAKAANSQWISAAANDQLQSSPEMIFIRGGTFAMGADNGMPNENPIHDVVVRSFWIDAHEVTTAEFAKFIAATHYQTDAERIGWSGTFDIKTGQWERTSGANWQHPEGPWSRANADEPVCQVSWNDALAYARWAGKRLPTEAEWEHAARGGLNGKTYPWGDELRPNGKPVANWWQGSFPDRNTAEDGYAGRAPVEKFPPNGYGLFDMVGNVWEWCADWYGDDYYDRSDVSDPPGPIKGTERVIRGGSWMCSENYCANYRVSARSHATPNSGMNNLGFRCVRD